MENEKSEEAPYTVEFPSDNEDSKVVNPQRMRKEEEMQLVTAVCSSLSLKRRRPLIDEGLDPDIEQEENKRKKRRQSTVLVESPENDLDVPIPMVEEASLPMPPTLP